MVGIQTTFRARVKRVFAAAVAIGAAIGLTSCATVMEAPKRSLLDSKCQERVIRMLNTVSPVVAETDIPKKFCGCFTQKVDVAKLEKDIDEVKDIALNPETLKFVTEYIPTIRTCAKETGLWKGL
jgi:hypothetical protein